MDSVSWDPPEPDRLWHLSMWTERKPVPMLERDILTRFAAALGRCLEEAGSGFRQDGACFVNGYCYMATSPLTEDEIAERRRRHAEHAAELEASGTDIYEGDVRPLLEARLAQVRKARRSAKTRPRLVDALDAAIEAATDAMGNWHWRMWPPSPFDWKAVYTELTGRPESEAGVLLSGLGHATARLVARMCALGRLVQSDPALLDAAARGDLDAIATFPEFATSFERLLRDHGRRTGYGLGSNVNFHTPTWSMRPGMVLDLIVSYARRDLDAVDAAERRAKRQRTALARRVRAQLAGEPEKLERFEVAYARAIGDIKRNEHSNQLIEQETMGNMREAIDTVGRFFVASGDLDHPDDAYHLTLTELRDLDPSLMRGLVKERQAELQGLAALEPPNAIGAAAVGAAAPGRASHPPAEPAAAVPPEVEGVLRGVAVSPGRITGRATIAASTAEPPDIEPGDILVARDAGPAWTPVFPIVSALVLDGGHIADHAAIMARDLGIPAVMRTVHATARITDGSTITVDGDTGTVTYEGVPA